MTAAPADATDDDPPRILAFGHSHMQSVVEHDIWSEETAVLPAPHHRDVFFLRGRNPRDEHYWSTAIASSARYRLALFWGGSEHYADFLLSFDDGFDFVCRQAPHLPLRTHGEIVPGAMVQNYFQKCMAPMAVVLHRLRAVGASGVVVSPPPPKDLSADEILDRLEAFFLSKIEARGLRLDQVGFSSSTLMLKLWYALCAVQRDVAAQCGFAFVEPPACASDHAGFLAPKYWQPDITHANAHYGTALLERLRPAVATPS